ncbi:MULTISPECIES: IclR family transcriptional regulator [unclassified Streptomyces]|uniref:IclR family transcriptional regulator n=1 Tax=unclassified Streptomyces TaxID=2593676 RepID=UPI0038281006
MDSAFSTQAKTDAGAACSLGPTAGDGEPLGGGSSSILWKAFAILGVFDRDRNLLTLSEISRRSGLPKSTAHRVIKMLVELGALARGGEDYRLGPLMFSFGSRSGEIVLREVAMPHLVQAATRTGHLVQLGVLRGRDVLYLAKVGGRGSLNPVPVGDRLEAHMTALGKAILAFSDERTVATVLDGPLARRTPATVTDRQALSGALSQALARRIATDRQEAVPGLHCLAVPIVTRGRAAAAISVCFPASVGSGEQFVPVLQETSARIARALLQTDALEARVS